MGRACDICGKKVQFGNQVERRGKAKYLGGVGRKITGRSRRKFKPNTQKVRAFVDGGVRRLVVCTACMRSGKVIRPPVRLRTPEEEAAAAEEAKVVAAGIGAPESPQAPDTTEA